MLNFEDSRWTELTAGYRTLVDLRPLLRGLEEAADPAAAWGELWQELYHQGDVGPGSYVAVPHLVRIHVLRGKADWNTYALVATIELARGRRDNPDIPDADRLAYDTALGDLAVTGLKDLPTAKDPETVRSILALLAIVYGTRHYGRVLLEFTEDDLLELEKQTFGEPSSARTDKVKPR
jgi:hypothetical protein